MLKNTLDQAVAQPRRALHSKTTIAPFCEIPADNNAPLFQVAAGVCIDVALGEIECLEAGALAILNDCIGSAGANISTLWLANFALHAARALRVSVGVEA